jgi:hypothetical protein
VDCDVTIHGDAERKIVILTAVAGNEPRAQLRFLGIGDRFRRA